MSETKRVKLQTNVTQLKKLVNTNIICGDLPQMDYRISNEQDDILVHFNIRTILDGGGLFVLYITLYDNDEFTCISTNDVKMDINDLAKEVTKYANQYIQMINDEKITYNYFERDYGYHCDGDFLYIPLYNFRTDSFMNIPEYQTATFAITDELTTDKVLDALKR